MLEAGKRTCVHTCGARDGYDDLRKWRRWDPDYWIESPQELAP